MSNLTRGEILGAAKGRLLPHIERYGIDDRAVTLMAFYEGLWDCAPNWTPITEVTNYPTEESMNGLDENLVRYALQDLLSELDYDLKKSIDEPEDDQGQNWDSATDLFMYHYNRRARGGNDG